MTEWGNPPYPDWLWAKAVELGLIAGDPNYYKNGEATGHEYINAVMHSLIALVADNIEEPPPEPEPDPERETIRDVIDNWSSGKPLVLENKDIYAPRDAPFAVRGHPDWDVTLVNCVVYGGQDALKNNANTQDCVLYLNYGSGHGDCFQLENRGYVTHQRSKFYAYRDNGAGDYANACFQVQSDSAGEGARQTVIFEDCHFEGGNYHGQADDQGGGMPTVKIYRSTYNGDYRHKASIQPFLGVTYLDAVEV